jgi:soluble lytic murein transglycosylase
MTASPAESPAASRQVTAWMQGIDLLRAAGFQDEASAEADRVVAAAGADRQTLYALAEALAERGYSQRAIRIGLRLQGSAQPNRRLLRILYPFPYRTLITEEARGRDFDPFIAAALIRQESMFNPRARSPVGALGLMQVMPNTGTAVARGLGIGGFRTDRLTEPELNLRIGTKYLADQIRSHNGRLVDAIAAYNAGPHRVTRWKQFPEYRDPEIFIERIPFEETRNYVKIVQANAHIYRELYGEP